jgi:hypothetical protein
MTTTIFVVLSLSKKFVVLPPDTFISKFDFYWYIEKWMYLSYNIDHIYSFFNVPKKVINVSGGSSINVAILTR